MARWLAEWPTGTRVIWRALTWAEYRDIQSRDFSSVYARYAAVYDVCLLEGPEAEQAPAGVVQWVGKRELDNNPFCGKPEIIAAALQTPREAVQSNYLLAARGLLAAFFHYSFEEIDKWDSRQLLLRIAQLENVLGRPIDPLPKQEPPKQRGRMRGRRNA